MNKREKILRGVVIGVLAAVMLFSGWKVIDILGGYRKSQSVYSSAADEYTTVQTAPENLLPGVGDRKNKSEDEDSIREDLQRLNTDKAEAESAPVSVNFDAMVKEYPDVVGWIFIPGTVINYPVLCGTEENYYIDHLYDGEPNANGSIFMDRRNEDDFSDKNTVLYGHHMKDGSMFAALDGYRKQDFADEHSTIWLLTPDKTYMLKPFSAYITSSTSGAYELEFPANSSFSEWCTDRVDNSGVIFETTPKKNDRIVTLSTCSYEYAEARFVVHCVLVEAE